MPEPIQKPNKPWRLRARRLFIKLRHWEYWPFAVVYTPIIPIWWWFSLKARSLFFFNAANPAIAYGGFLMEKKSDIYPLLPEGSYPATYHFAAGTLPKSVLAQVQHLGFPLIAKPDIGMQGKRVKKIHDAQTLQQYILTSPVDFLVQAFVPYPNEVGIFYQRFPGAAQGQITGVVGKAFATVTGNGKHTVAELLQQHDRYLLQWQALQEDPDVDMTFVPAPGESYLLAPYGNHARGALFLDASSQVDEALSKTIDNYCQQIPGFYYGRLDIRYDNWNDLCAGKHFSVIELNGAGSEPTHMYDPQHSLWYAWKEIIRHWNLLHQTALAARRYHGTAFMTWQQGLTMYRKNRAHVKRLSQAA